MSKINQQIYESYDVNRQRIFWETLNSEGFTTGASIAWYNRTKPTAAERAVWWEHYRNNYFTPDDDVFEEPFPEDEDEFGDMEEPDGPVSSDPTPVPSGPVSSEPQLPALPPSTSQSACPELPVIGFDNILSNPCLENCRQEAIEAEKVCDIMRQRVAQWMKDNGCPTNITSSK